MKRLFPLLVAVPCMGFADDEVPTREFTPERYQQIWLSSPFAVASEPTPATPETPSLYKLVGVSRFSGIAYASILNTQNNTSLFLEQNKVSGGLTLLSISVGKPGESCSAKVSQNGQILDLQTENKPPNSPPEPTAVSSGGPIGSQLSTSEPHNQHPHPPTIVIQKSPVAVPSKP